MMKRFQAQSKLAEIIFGDKSKTNRFPIFNNIILIYIGAVLLCYTLFLVVPFTNAVAQTPFYHMQTYLGVLGAVLCAVDLFTNRGLWRGPYVILMYLMCGIAMVSSVRMMRYGVSDNLFLICWTVIQFALFYSCAFRMEKEKLEIYLKWIFAVLLLVWTVACIVSLSQYVFQIGYWQIIDPLSEDSSLARQGFIENRLFGVFNPLNHAVYVSMMLGLTGIYYIIKSKRIVVKILLGLADFLLFIHIILSGSRSALVALYAVVFVFSFLQIRKKLQGKNWQHILISFVAPFVCVAIFVGCFNGVKVGLTYLPELGGEIGQSTFIKDFEGNNIEYDAEILEREGLTGDISNERFQIWEDYLSLYKEIGLIGLSPSNYMKYVCENHPEKYIVEQIRLNYPEKYNAGVIYHVHNGYLMVFVSAGILGVALMLVFVALCLRRVVLYVFKNRQTSVAFVCAITVACSGVISAAFDKGVFFMNSVPTFLFWIALGIVMKESSR